MADLRVRVRSKQRPRHREIPHSTVIDRVLLIQGKGFDGMDEGRVVHLLHRIRQRPPPIYLDLFDGSPGYSTTMGTIFAATLEPMPPTAGPDLLCWPFSMSATALRI